MNPLDIRQFKSRILEAAESARLSPDRPQFPEPSTDPAWELAIADPDDLAFLRTAYARILGRKADLPGLLHHLRNLREGLPRALVLETFYSSKEALTSGTGTQGRPGKLQLKWAQVQYALAAQCIRPLHKFLSRASGNPERVPSRLQVEHLASQIDDLSTKVAKQNVQALETRIEELTRRLSMLQSNIESLLHDTKASVRDEVTSALWSLQAGSHRSGKSE